MSTFLNAKITADGNYKKRVLFISDEVDLHGYRNILKGRSFPPPPKDAPK
ncbi:conjugal transfer coupling protein TraG [Bartonella henselae]|uniref:Conjugal transfer coupling protein TraG n=1 Tax=Bartonella henselae TaxID=38323 RepID=X5MI70_BARHN|nr:conjugal transfer coupling protein TraG [Bartonella henselae]